MEARKRLSSSVVAVTKTELKMKSPMGARANAER